MLAFDIARIVAVGVGATLVMDAWLFMLARAGLGSSSFALMGRWAGHMVRGRFAHAAIAKAAPIRGELALGWLLHYAVGIAFAALLVAVVGTGWLRAPTPAPAVAFGLLTVAMPLLVMQPAMGGGLAASKTPRPLATVARSVANHAVFGIGLYAAAVLVAAMVG